jgi:hypothetical protein
MIAASGCLPGGREHLWSRRLVMNYHEAEAVLSAPGEN